MADQALGSFPGLQAFLFETPLYAQFLISEKWGEVAALFREDMNFKVDGYCPFCRRLSTFSRAAGGATFNSVTWSHHASLKVLEVILLAQCARNLLVIDAQYDRLSHDRWLRPRARRMIFELRSPIPDQSKICGWGLERRPESM